MATSLNKVVEQVAYKQVEDLIVYMEMLSDQIIQTSKVAKANQITFSTPAVSNGDMNKKLAESSAIVKKLQSDYSKLQNSYDNLIKKVDNYTTAKKNNTTAITNNSISQSQLLKNVKEEEVKTSSLTTYIQKLSVDRIRASRVVADYNAQIALGTKLTEEQSNELAQATVQFQKYDKAIKAGKASIGDAREYVGQYERANTGLSNSVAQIARELPAATYGFQTFALGISNNFPIMVDEIKKAVEINAELIKKGEEIVPVWKQVTNALFSFNTAMSIGLLLLALYGKEIANFVTSLFSASDGLKELTEQQLKYNESSKDASLRYEKSVTGIEKLLSIGVSETASVKAKNQAYKELTENYEEHSKGLTKQMFLNGQTETFLKRVTVALRAQSKEIEGQNAIDETEKRIQDLNREINARTNYTKKVTELELQIKTARRASENTSLGDEYRKSQEQIYNTQLRSLEALNKEEKLRKSKRDELDDDLIKEKNINKIIQTRDLLTKQNLDNQQKVNEFRAISIELDIKSEKSTDSNTKAIKLNTKAREDYLISEYELWKLRKTNDANLNKDIMNDEASSYDLRLLASEQYHSQMIELAQREAQEEQRILKYALEERNRTLENERTNEIEQVKNQLTNNQISQSDYYTKLKDIEENYQYDKAGIQKNFENNSLKISENYAQNYLNIQKEMVGKMITLYDNINFAKAELEIASVDLSGVEKLKSILESIGDNMSIEEIKGKLNEVTSIANDNAIDMAKRNADIELKRKEAQSDRIIDEIYLNGVLNGLSDEEIANQIYSNQELLKLDKELIDSKKKVTEADIAELKKQKDNKLQFLEEQRKINEETYNMQVELGRSIADLANQLFSNSIEKYDRQIEKSNEYYDSLIANAEKGSEQELLLQEEKQRAEEELQKRKIEIQRKQAVFNKLIAITEIGLELAKTIAKINLLATVLTAMAAINPLLAPLVATVYAQIPLAIATSAVQVGAVLATPLPQYKDGRGVGKDEFAIVGDGGVSEVIERGNGKIEMTPNKSTLTYLGAKDKVHSSLEDFQKSKLSLENASIMASFANQKMQLEMFDYYLGRELKGLPDRIEKSIEKGFQKSKNNVVVNNNINLPKRSTNFFN